MEIYPCRAESEFRGNLQSRPGGAQGADEDLQCAEGELASGTADKMSHVLRYKAVLEELCLLHQCEFDYADVVPEVLTPKLIPQKHTSVCQNTKATDATLKDVTPKEATPHT